MKLLLKLKTSNTFLFCFRQPCLTFSRLFVGRTCCTTGIVHVPIAVDDEVRYTRMSLLQGHLMR